MSALGTDPLYELQLAAAQYRVAQRVTMNAHEAYKLASAKANGVAAREPSLAPRFELKRGQALVEWHRTKNALLEADNELHKAACNAPELF